MDLVQLEKIYIYGLFDQYNIQFDLSKRCNVFIGENGIGKTTILKIVNLILNGNIAGLISYPFEKIVLGNKNTKIENSIVIDSTVLFPEYNYVYAKLKEKFEPRKPLKGQHKINQSLESYEYQNKAEFSKKTLEFLTQLKQKGILNKYYSNLYNKSKQTSSIEVLKKSIFLGDNNHSQSESIEMFDAYIQSLIEEHLKSHNNQSIENKLKWELFNGSRHGYKNSYYINLVSDFEIDSSTVTQSSVTSATVTWLKDTCFIGYGGEFTSGRTVNGICFGTTGLENVFGKEDACRILKKVCTDVEDFELDRKNSKEVQEKIYGNKLGAGRRAAPARSKWSMELENENKLMSGYISDVLDKKVFPVNRIINRLFYEDEFVVEFNVRALEIYAAFLGDAWYEMEVEDDFIKGFDNVFGEKIRKTLNSIKEPTDFLDNMDIQNDILEYIYPILAKDSMLFIDFDSMQFKSHYTEKSRCYALMALYLDKIDDLKNEANRSSKLKKLVFFFEKYFQNKIVIVKPSGLSFKKYNMLLGPKTNDSQPNENIFKEISIDMLSSGEKKLLLIFTLAVYFDDRDDERYNNFVSSVYLLLDEPELSLSILWQETLLPDLLKETKNTRLVVATHSPYIVSEEMMKNYIVYLPTEVVIKGNE